MVMTVEERKEGARVASRKFYNKNKEKVKASSKAYRDNNKEKCRFAKNKYNAKNRDKVNALSRKWVSENKDTKRAVNTRYEANNSEKISIAKAKYRAENRDKVNALLAKYRATKFGATIYMTKEDRAKIAELYTIANDATKLFGYGWAVDHIVPLNKGGLHKLSNLQVVPASWNCAKGDRNSDVYWG